MIPATKITVPWAPKRMTITQEGQNENNKPEVEIAMPKLPGNTLFCE